MSEEVLADESHYEISLTAGQAFIAFVLLLLSLAASFGFGLLIGRGQGDDRLVVRKEPGVVNEARTIAKKAAGHIVELGVAEDDFQKQRAAKTDSTVAAAPAVTEQPTPAAQNDAPLSANGGGEASAHIAGAQNGNAQNATAAPASHSIIEPVPAKSDAWREGASTAAAKSPGSATSASNAQPAQSAAAVPPSTSHQTPATTQNWGPVYAQLLVTTDQKTAENLAANVINGGFTSAYVERGTSPKGPAFRVRVKFASESEARAALPKLKTYANDAWIAR